jgi:hypothetical protein
MRTHSYIYLIKRFRFDVVSRQICIEINRKKKDATGCHIVAIRKESEMGDEYICSSLSFRKSINIYL